MTLGAGVRVHPSHYPHDGTYADLLAWHLKYWGTREDGDTAVNGQPWDDLDFRLKAFPVDGQDAARVGLRNWLATAKPPNSAPNETNHSLIKKALFGSNPNFADWRSDLDDACERSKEGRNGRTRDFPEPPPPPKILTKPSIPRLTRYFVGRETSVREVVAMFQAAPKSAAVLIQGGPGIGKTELTKAVARHPDIVKRFGERRWFVPLETATTAAEVQKAIIDSMGCDRNLGFETALKSLRGEQVLLVLDHLQTPLLGFFESRSAVEILISDIISMGNISIISSIRGLYDLDGADWIEYTLSGIGFEESISLFSKISGKWILNDLLRKELIYAMEGNALAITLLAKSTLGINDCDRIMCMLNTDGINLLKVPDCEPGRLTSFKHSLDISVVSPPLSDSEKRFIGLLGKFPGGLSRNDRSYLMGLGILRVEAALLRRGLASQAGDRIYLSPPIRLYAYEYFKISIDDYKLLAEYMTDLIGQICKSFNINIKYSDFISNFCNIDDIFFKYLNMVGPIVVNNRTLGDHDFINIRYHLIEHIYTMRSYAIMMMKGLHGID